MAVTGSQAAELTTPRRKKAKLSPRETVLAAKFRRKYGVPPKGPGPHPDGCYGFAMPPSDHPAARKCAKAILQRRNDPKMIEKFGVRAIARQVAKARTHLYGSPNPSKIEVEIARTQARLRRLAAPHVESSGFPTLRYDVVAVVGKSLASLREAVVTDAAPGIARVVLIREGPGNLADRHFYTASALERAVPLFNGAQCYVDHPTSIEEQTQPERSVRALAGYFDNAAFGDYDDPVLGTCKAIYADFHPEIGNLDVLSRLRTASMYADAHPTKAYIGFSINALGSGAPAVINGEEWNRVDEISEVLSTDIVTRAGAGGKLLSFKESDRMSTAKDPSTEELLAQANKLLERAEQRRSQNGGGRVRVGLSQTKVREGVRKLTAEREKLLIEAIKKKIKEDAAAAGTGAPPAITSDMIDQLGQNLGVVPDSALDMLLDQAAGVAQGDGTNDGSGNDFDTTEGDDVTEASSGGGKSLDDMSKSELLAWIAGKMGKTAAGAGAAQESNAKVVTEAAKLIAAANLREKDAAAKAEASETKLREVAASGVLVELAIPESFRPRLKRELLERATPLSPAQMLEVATEWKAAYVTPQTDGVGATGRFHESGRVSVAPNCLAP